MSTEMFISDNYTMKGLKQDLRICRLEQTTLVWVSSFVCRQLTGGKEEDMALLIVPLSCSTWWLLISSLIFPCLSYQTTHVLVL